MDGIINFIVLFVYLIDYDFRKKNNVSRDPNPTTINEIESLVERNIVGKHKMLISQEVVRFG
jgi:hypothetical protein